MITCPYSWNMIEKAMIRKNYRIFHSKPYDLNLIGIRTGDSTSNRFDDWFTVSYLNMSGIWCFHTFPCTTDPGLFWRKNPENAKGVAILKEGQHRGMWTLGKHRGRYEALVQARPVPVYRDSNRDEVLDLDPESIDVGIFGINLHRAKEDGESVQVDKWSAGCQVLASDLDFEYVISLCKMQAKLGLGKSFTYTLLTHEDLVS